MDINILKSKLTNPDIKIREININYKIIYIIFVETICKSNTINDFILRGIINKKVTSIKDIKNNIYDSQIKDILNEKDFFESLYMGFTIICIDNDFISFETKESLDSGIQVSQNEKSIKGPKDSFTENYQTNIGLIRKRIRSNYLTLKEFKIGNDSITNVSMIFMSNICNKNFAKKIEKKLSLINIDYVANSNYISDILDKNNNIIPSTLSTERPDLASFSLMKGKIVIIVENSPQVLILPTSFMDFIHTQDDYYQNSKNVTLTRIIRLTALVLSLIVPSLYLALTTFNQETLPTGLLINFSIQREGVPFPSVVEALILWLIFEILKESDTRIPYVFGTSMSIVGALVLGDAAVNAGLISPIMIIIISISAISTFLFSDNDMVNSLRIWKLIFLLLSSIVGLYGIFIAFLLFIIKLCNTESYGFDYLNFENYKDFFDSIILTKKYKFNKRESYLTTNTKRR